MKSRGERRQNIRAGVGDIAQNIHLDGTDLSQAQAHVRTGAAAQAAINLGEAFFQVGIGLIHGHAVQIKRAQHIYIDAALRRNGAAKRGLVAAKNVNDHLVSGAQPVIAGRGQVLTGREIQVFIPENIASINVGLFRYRCSGGFFLLHRSREFLVDGMRAPQFLHDRLGFLAHLSLVLRIDTHGLGTGNSFDGKFLHQNILGLSFFESFLHVFRHLFVRHGTLCPCGNSCQQETGEDKYGKFLNFLHKH